MFSGIVEEQGRVRQASASRLEVSARMVLEGSKLGDSLAVNGVCLTVTDLYGDAFGCDLMPETARRSNLGSLQPGDTVNLERAIPASGRLGGHFVQGHVEATAEVLSLEPEGEALLVRYGAPPEAMRYIVPKGFIAVDGVSLTVVDRDATSFRVSLVRHTLEHTNLGSRQPGERVNLEPDILAKYVEQLLPRG